MEEDIIIKVKKELEEKKKIQEKLKMELDELNELKNDLRVQKFLELSKLDNKSNREFINKTDEDFLYDAYKYYGVRINETNNVYFCLGTYGYSSDPNNKKPIKLLLEENAPNAVFKLYKNIEDERDYFEVLLDAVPEFERTHKVIHATMYFSNIEYHNIKEYFFKDTILEGQDIALKRVLEKDQGYQNEE